MTTENMLVDFIAALGDDPNGDGTPGTAADKALSDRFLRLMQSRPADLDSIAQVASSTFRNAMLHDLYNEITNSDFDGVGAAQDGDISHHWKQALGMLTSPAARASLSAPAAAPLSFEITGDVNGDGIISLDDLEAKETLERAVKILADSSVVYSGDLDANGVIDFGDVTAFQNILETQKIIFNVTSAFKGDLTGDDLVDAKDVSVARKIIAAYDNVPK